MSACRDSFFAASTNSETFLMPDAGFTTSRTPPIVIVVIGLKSATGSYGRSLNRLGFAAWVVLLVIKMTFALLGRDLAVWMPMIPLAPGRLSTTTALPVDSVIFWPMYLAATSVAVAAANGTTIVMGAAFRSAALTLAATSPVAHAKARPPQAWTQPIRACPLLQNVPT